MHSHSKLWPHVRLGVRALSLALLVTAVVMWLALPARRGAAQGSDFVLQSARGPLDSHSLRGQIVLLYFGYTFCPDICPTTLSDMARAIGSLDEASQRRVRGVFVSLDPERDDVRRLAEYSSYFHPRITGVTGSEAQLRRLVSSYGATFQRVPLEDGGGYAVEHPGSVFVLNTDGALVGRISHGAPQDEWRRALAEVL